MLAILAVLVWDRLGIIVSMLGSRGVPSLQGFSNAKGAFVDDTRIIKIYAMVERPRMSRNVWSISTCFDIRDVWMFGLVLPSIYSFYILFMLLLARYARSAVRILGFITFYQNALHLTRVHCATFTRVHCATNNSRTPFRVDSSENDLFFYYYYYYFSIYFFSFISTLIELHSYTLTYNYLLTITYECILFLQVSYLRKKKKKQLRNYSFFLKLQVMCTYFITLVLK